ncbi:TetR/AcrR family transcriptional regulator [Sporosalibacterium faouarense]|uniref:TetR/AcrR family transcriptional regulator n=1 Tax=Sporosalibacterium faouarense TaxID=516123 RepID=UPI00141D7353|nr:TetR/AcrR family transcriptional regulator [Sporosalibacterium faouarense]MTI47528.1 TetR/AcrR family transcriptional regulator [Bacillota bacterium]
MTNEIKNMSQAQRILNAAFKCVASEGYANVSMRNIADEAGVVLSQLNYYYKNKEGLFIAIIKDLSKDYLKEIENKLKEGESAKERIYILIEYFQNMLRDTPELFKTFFDLTSMSLWSPTLQKLQNELFNDMANSIEKYIIREFSDKEKFRCSSSKALSRMMLGTLFGTSIQVILAEEKEEMINSLLTLKVLFE